MKHIDQDGTQINRKDKLMKKSVAKNYIYNLIYQILTIFLPLVTMPYLSRILGAEAIGIFGYTGSIASYFILFGSLGIALYGQREIAYKSNDKTEMTKSFLEIFIVKTITSLISIIIFYLIYCREGQYAFFYRLLSIQLFAGIMDVSWFFQGIEEFDKNVTRNLIVKLISIISIFVFVKTSDDLWKYFMIFVCSELFGNLSIWLYMPRYLCKVKFNELNFTKHIKPTLSLFVPQISIQIYTVLDKTMIGVLTNDMKEVGYYDQAQKIVKTALVAVTALQTVMNSRVANAYSNNNNKEIKESMTNTFKYVWFLSIPITFGLIAVSSQFVPWFYGEGYERVIPIINAMAPILIAIGLNSVTGVQYLVQIGKQNILTLSVTIGAIVNVILNIILIKLFGGIGAAISSVIAEFIILTIQLYNIKDQYTFTKIFKLSVKCFIGGIVMYIVVSIISKHLNISIINTIIEIAIGAGIYFLVLVILKEQYMIDIYKQLNNILISKFKRRKKDENFII